MVNGSRLIFCRNSREVILLCACLPDGGTAPCQIREPEDARRALREGIEEARRQNLTHAAGEMAELLVSIGDA